MKLQEQGNHAVVAFASEVPSAPRRIDPLRTFDALVAWLKAFALEKRAPGFIIGISGTDSILAFLACAKAFEELGKPGRVLAVHYGAPFPPPAKTADEISRILEANPSYRWFARVVVPWLQAQAPQAQVLTDDTIDYTDDYQRWAALFRRSVAGNIRGEMPKAGENYWIVGTRNASEQAIGAYSNISGAVSMQPLINLWKSEILDICAALGVPSLAIEKSRQVDCDCGRFDIAADHINEVDLVLMARARLISQSWLRQNMAPALLEKLEAFVDEQIAYTRFKREIPYTPPESIIIEQR